MYLHHREPSFSDKAFLAGLFMTLAFVVPLILICILSSGCSSTPPVPPRSQARAAVMVTSEAVRAFGETCANYALDTQDLPLAERCQEAYDAARMALIATAAGVDGWVGSSVARESIICSLRRALGQMSETVRYLELRNVSQAVWHDAMALVGLLGQCAEVRT